MIDSNALREEQRLANRNGFNTGLQVADIDMLRRSVRNNPALAREMEDGAARYVARVNKFASVAANARRNAQTAAMGNANP